MRLLNKAQPKKLLTLALAFVLALSLFAGLKFSYLSGSAEEPDYTTEISNIYVKEIAKSYFFTFELTNNDYNEASGSENFEKLEAYERYIAVQCSYWSNFHQMNSEGATLPSIFIYWNGGVEGNLVGVYPNAISHRVAGLDSLYYGFIIAIPAGTDFPSYDFVKNGCDGAPVFYTTTTSKAFYYDGNGFTELPYEISTLRTEVDEEIQSVDLSLYEDAEREQVKALIKEARKNVKGCISVLEIEDAKKDFENSLDQIMTKADYAELAVQKNQARLDVQTLFDALNESDYNETAWAKILSIREQSDSEIEMIDRFGELEHLVNAIKNSINGVVTLTGWADFEAYRQAAVSNLEGSFDATLYLETEKVQGEALVQEGKQKILDCVTYKDVDVFEAEYISKINALKVIQTEESQNLGWIFAIIGAAVLLLGAAVVVMLIINKNKKKEKKGEQNEE